jgi:FlgD Ig-like domain
MRQSHATVRRRFAIVAMGISLLASTAPAVAAVDDPAPTVTTLTLDPLPPVLSFGDALFINARVSPVQTNVTRGDVQFSIDGVWADPLPIEFDGVARFLYTASTLGAHSFGARYLPDALSDPALPSEAEPVTTDVRKGVDLQWQPGSESPTLEGGNLHFSVLFNASGTPSSGTLRIRDETTSTTLGEMAVTSNLHTLTTGDVQLAAGTHHLVAEFNGDATFFQRRIERDFEVVADTGVDANQFKLSSTTFYPVKDGYKDAVAISAWCVERCSGVIKIYDAKNKVVRSITIGPTTGNPYRKTWDGRTSSGALVASGVYRVSHQLKDALGNSKIVNQTLTLSHRSVRWVSTSTSKYGANYSAVFKGGSGKTSTTSSYTKGRRISGGSGSGYAALRYVFKLHSGLAYRSVKANVLGRGTTSSSRAILAWYTAGAGALVGPKYGWYSHAGSASTDVVAGIARFDVEADGPMSGWFDIAKTKLSYQYAVWK